MSQVCQPKIPRDPAQHALVKAEMLDVSRADVEDFAGVTSAPSFPTAQPT